MKTQGNIISRFIFILENLWAYLKNYAQKCRLVYANAFFT